ncbi:site-specific integrase [Deinococcus sp. S9]|uniref:tyrosine-type recombinase/integrase n=1 Tax=Deinococcus sp. S9 TaxID=2545754 RepID=UPI0014045A09|nr:site-specific integrase [Deinococcus sp. S9]
MPPRKTKKKKERSRANGQGTVYASRDKFRWQFVVPGRDGREGIRLSGTELTREAAELKLTTVRADHARGLLKMTPQGPITFREYAERYMKQPHGWADTSRARYTVLARYAGDCLGDMPLTKIKPPDIRRMIAQLAERKSESSRNPGQTLSLETINTTLWLVRNILQDAVTDELIPANPTLNIRVPRPGRDEHKERQEALKVYDFHEAERFCRLGQGLWEDGALFHWPALYTMLSLGLRRGEVAALRWDDLDFERGFLHVRQSLNYQKKITAPKTKSSLRRLPLPPSVAELLRSLPRDFEAVFAYRGKYPDPNLYTKAMTSLQRWSDPEKLAGNLRGALAQGIEISPHLTELIEQGDPLPRLNPHGLRHTYATLALRKGVPIEVVSKTLGHAQISMTYNRYRHVLESEMQQRSVDLFSFAPH